MLCKTHFCAALAALFLLPPLAANPVSAFPSPPPALAATDIALAEAIADRPLTPQEKTLITVMDQDLFGREPDALLQGMRQEIETLKRFRRFDPVSRADWRKAQLTADYFSQDTHGDPKVNKTYLAIYTRKNPIIYADPDSKTIICQRDLDAWLAVTRVLSAASGIPAGDTRPMIAAAHDPDFSWMPRINASHMERNWICYQLCWPHEPAADRKKMLAGLVKNIRRAAAKRPAGGYQDAEALELAASAYSDYPASMNPKYAARAGFIKRSAMWNEIIQSSNEKVTPQNAGIP